MISRWRRPRNSAAEAETEGGARLHLVGEAGVVEAQLADGGAQVLEVGGVDREEAAEHHRDHFLEALEGFGGGLLLVGDGVADGGVGHFLDRGGEEADLAGAKLGDVGGLGREDADLVDAVGGAGLHHADLLAGLQRAVEDAHQDDDAEVGVVPGVDQQGLQRGVAVALGRGQAGDDGFQHVGDADARLGRALDGVGGVQADDVLDLRLDAVDVGGGEVDLVQDRDDLVVVVDGLVDIGQGLGLDALGGVDDQDRAFAGGQGPADLVGEVDVPGGVHQVEDIGLAVGGLVGQAHGLRLDGDPALLLDVHVVQDLGAHLARGQAAGRLDQPIRERGFSVVNVSHD